MSLERYAKAELDRIPKDDDEYQEMMNEDILEIVRIFAKQGHCGSTASYAIPVLNRLLQFKPLSPLTGDDDEWNEVADGVFQNKRCGDVFKNANGTAHYNEAKIFSDDGGETWYTNVNSRVEITFPFTVPDKPEKVLVHRQKEEGEQ